MNQLLEQLITSNERNIGLRLNRRSLKDELAANSEAPDFFSKENRRRIREENLRRLNAILEQRVAARTEALECVNSELESFSYSVSHDLRVPLRHIAGFTALVMQANEGKLDATSTDYLQRIALAAQRMTSLIDDLLQLSSVSHVVMRRMDFSLSDLSATVSQVLAREQPRRDVSVVIAPNMQVEGDFNLIRIVMENLLGNAWKFTSRTGQAKIEVGQHKRDGEQIYFVRDNGAGFDMKYSEKLFGAFQRMHTQSEFEGTGIGLSIVQRIVAKHEGRIWAEAEVGKGAVFYFTLGRRA
ncbi:MAG: ATP-binding protein [Pyrinomonadaceae bacterium]